MFGEASMRPEAHSWQTGRAASLGFCASDMDAVPCVQVID